MQFPTEDTWDFWQDGAHSPAFNMAADEALLETAMERGRPVLRVYSWDRPSVSIGYIQQRASAPEGFAVVRRPTGGGIVYHDMDYTYTVVFPEGHWLTGLDRTMSYDWINRAVQAALNSLKFNASLSQDSIPHDVDRLTMVCFTNPTKYDILFDGRKVAGSAQRRTNDGILHQGSIHFGRPLPFPREALTEHLLAAFKDIMKITFSDFSPTDGLMAKIAEKVADKYDTDEWNNRR